MTQLPNLPTDSLYKFIALSGIALFIAGSILSFYSADMHFENTQHMKIETEFSEEQKQLINSQPLFRSDDPRLQDLPPEYLNQSNERLHNINKANRLSIYSYIMTIFGVFLSFNGFVFWYRNLQRHIDNIVKKRAESL